MIDTDKYEGHQVSEFKTSVAGPNHSWVTHRHTAGAKDAMFVNHATAALITDAPLLLAEVKRLREEFTFANSAASNLGKYAGKLSAEVERLRGLLQEVADEYTDADGITYEIYCEFGGEEE